MMCRFPLRKVKRKEIFKLNKEEKLIMELERKEKSLAAKKEKIIFLKQQSLNIDKRCLNWNMEILIFDHILIRR